VNDFPPLTDFGVGGKDDSLISHVQEEHGARPVSAVRRLQLLGPGVVAQVGFDVLEALGQEAHGARPLSSSLIKRRLPPRAVSHVGPWRR
jgi:hypothetical protein